MAAAQLGQRLRDNDLVGYARALATPAQYRQLAQAWRDGRSQWPLTELPLSERLPSLLTTLTRADAERRLQQAYDAQVAGQGAGLRQAVQALGLFASQYLGSQGDYSDEQRAFYLQLVRALSAWASRAPLADRDRAHAAIGRLVTAARATDLQNQADLRQVGMEESLRRLGPFLATLKTVLADYGLRLDDSLAGLRTDLLDHHGDQARVRIQYPLAGNWIDTPVTWVRHDGQWYPQRSQDEITALLTAADPDAAAALGR